MPTDQSIHTIINSTSLSENAKGNAIAALELASCEGKEHEALATALLIQELANKHMEALQNSVHGILP